MEADARCPCCSEKYSTDDDARLPIVLSCLCQVCKGCALKQEAEAATATTAAAAAGKQKKGKGKGKKKKKEGKKEEEVVQHNGMACQICKKLSTTPVADLPVDIAMVQMLESSSAAAAPLCACCAEEQATKYCNDCHEQRMLCDSCFTLLHSFAKKKGHTSIPIEEHLASAASHNNNGGGAAAHQPTTMCSIHTNYPLHVYCNTCNMLVCAMCGILEHKEHDLTPVDQAADVHRETIEAALAAVTVSRAEVVAAIAAIKVIKGQLEGNKDAAMAVIEEGFKKLMRAAKERKDALTKVVQGAYDEKLKALIAQLNALEDVDSTSEAAMALVVATLAAATPTELLVRSSLLENGLGQLQAHGVALEECEVSNMTVQLAKPFEESANDLRAIGWIDTGATHPAASTAAGDGLKSATVGEGATFVVTAFEVGGAGKKPRASGGDDVTLRFVCVGSNCDGEDEDSAEDNRGGGGGAAAAAKNGKRKRGSAAAGGKGRAGAKKSKTCASTSTSGGGGAAAADDTDFDDIVADNGDGTYTCSYTPPKGAETKQWQLEVLLNGKEIACSPFAVEVKKCTSSIKYVFRSVATGEYALSEGDKVATQTENLSWRGAIADGEFVEGGAGVGAAAAPMIEGQEYAEFEIAKNDNINGAWCFGVCRPGIDLNDAASNQFQRQDDTWMMLQSNDSYWSLRCSSNKGNFVDDSIYRKLNAGDRVGLLLDLDNGGTLTLYLDGKPCGTIAEGLVGPLHWCIASAYAGKEVRIHAGLEISPQ